MSTGTATGVGLSGLSPGATYYWHVRAINSVGTTYANGSSAAFWSFVTGNAPGAFAKDTPGNGALDQTTSPTLSWGTSSGVTRYEYCYDATNDSACSEWLSTATGVGLSGLSPGATYYWHVRAINSFGTTDADGSAFWSFTTTNLPPVLGFVGDKSTAEGNLLAFTLSATDPGPDTLTFSATGLPTGARLDTATGEFLWTPGYYQASEYEVTFTVSDGDLTDSETITITILNPAGPIFFDDFADGAALQDWRKASGNWVGSRRVYTAGSLTTNNLAQIVPLDPVTLPLGVGVVQAKVKLISTVSGAGSNGMLVFGYRDTRHYRWAKITKTEVQIGQTGTMGGIRGGIKKRVARSHAVGRFVLLTVRIHPSGWVRVYEGTATRPVATYRFLSEGLPSVVKGGVGLAATKARTIFDNVIVWEDSALTR